MKTNRQENRTNGSFEIPERRGNSIAGPSREASKIDAGASGADGTGQENNDNDYRGEDEHFNPVREVIRKTELLGWDVWPAHRSRRKAPVDPEEEPDNPEEE